MNKTISRYKAETELLIKVQNLAEEYVLNTRGKTLPDLADFLMVLQSQVDADLHERARVR
jgi:hypothetical protein